LLITPAKAARLRTLAVRQVDISVYSADPAVHDWVTKIPGSLERSLEGAAMLKEAGVTVKLNCPLMKQNVGQYTRLLALAERLGVLCGFDPMITAKNDGDRSPIALRITRKELREVLQDPALNPQCGKPAPAASGPDWKRSDLDDVPCGASHNACYISAYGDVMPCVAMPIACGNVRDEPFAEIWHRSPAMLRVRSIRIRDLHTCSSCAASPFCTRCPGQALVETGDLYGPSPANCERLRRHLVEGTARHLALSGELGRLLKSFEREHVPVIPLKGPVLAEMLYAHPALRPCSDLDLLIRREHLERVDELLRRLAYRRMADAHSFRFDVAYDHATLYAS